MLLRKTSERPDIPKKNLTGDNYGFLDELRKDYGEYGKKIVICGLMSCKGDAYNPAEALSVDEALVEEDPDVFVKDVSGLHRALDMKLLGGCCGTDGRHIERMAIYLVKDLHPSS